MASQRDLAKQLLRRAGDDEAAAKAMLPVEAVTDAIVGMLAQQGVEKSIKAVLAARGVDFPFYARHRRLGGYLQQRRGRSAGRPA